MKKHSSQKENTASILSIAEGLEKIALLKKDNIISEEEYQRLKNTDVYKTMREILTRQIATDSDVAVNMEKDLVLKDRIIAGSAEQLEKDRTLLAIAAITEDVYEEKQQQYLSKEEAYLNMKSSLLSKRSDINKSSLEIQRISIEETEAVEKALSELTSAANTLSNIIRLWKEKYLQVAPLDGELEYLGFWRENSFVNSGQELFSIIPDENDIVGEVMISSIGSGKIEIGQTANVKINKFPYDEYGLLKGRVESISRVSNRIETREGVAEAYQVIISFPGGFTTNFGIPLFLDFESKGTIEIITKPKRLIERLFDNLKTKTEK
ncbi:MAG: HlyD family secretion protein [Firmicutes bacterium]|nr:HlyD family secretion protein [Bacillota bacterium]